LRGWLLSAACLKKEVWEGAHLKPTFDFRL